MPITVSSPSPRTIGPDEAVVGLPPPRRSRLVWGVLRFGGAGAGLGLIWVGYALTIFYPSEPSPATMPFVVAALLALALIAICLLGRTHSLIRLIACVAVYATFLAGILALHNSSLGRFKATYRSIQLGMTEAEVRAIIDHQFPGRKPRVQFTPTGGAVGFTGLGEGSHGECFGFQFVNGVVVSKHYSPD